MNHKENLDIIKEEIRVYEFKCNYPSVDIIVRDRLKTLIAAKDKIINKIILEYE